MLDDLHDQMVRAAWYYHMEGMTQGDIAGRLNLTRRRVNEMLAEARQTGVVSISFNSPLQACAELELALCEAFGLVAAVVVPTPANPEDMHRVLGRAAADFFYRFIQNHRPKSIGVGWGTTMREIIRAARQVKLDDVRVYSMMGGLTQGTEINTFETVRGLAEVLGAKSEYFAAPIYMDTPQSREVVAAQAVFQRTFEAIANVDIALANVGDVSEKSLQVRYGLPEGVSAGDLTKAGAVGDLIGRYLDADGQEIDHVINRLVLAPTFEAFRRIPTRIVVSGGDHKHAIMRAVARAGHVNIVVTDVDCARAMLAK